MYESTQNIRDRKRRNARIKEKRTKTKIVSTTLLSRRLKGQTSVRQPYPWLGKDPWPKTRTLCKRIWKAFPLSSRKVQEERKREIPKKATLEFPRFSREWTLGENWDVCVSVDLLLEESEKTFEDMQLKRLHGSLLPLKGIENLPHPFIFHSLSLQSCKCLVSLEPTSSDEVKT